MKTCLELTLEKKHAYRIVIKPGLLSDMASELQELKSKFNRIWILTHPNLKKLYGSQLKENVEAVGYTCEILEVDEGETSKSMQVVESILSVFLEKQLERQDLVLSLGGGVIGDLAGFVASIALRGIPFVQIPTSLLAQVDASIGGKTGVNSPSGKNLIGSFYQPLKVCIDPMVLQSLDQRQFRSGFAEIVKYAVIWDKELFEYLENHMAVWTTFNVLEQKDKWLHIIKRSCEIKAQIVQEDETEKGVRAILNYGHTIGHAIEAEFSFNRYLHGEAVALGMIAANNIAQQVAGLNAKEAERIKKMLQNLGFNLKLSNCNTNHLIRYLNTDKKRLERKHRFILPEKIGKVCIQSLEDDCLIRESIQIIME